MIGTQADFRKQARNEMTNGDGEIYIHCHPTTTTVSLSNVRRQYPLSIVQPASAPILAIKFMRLRVNAFYHHMRSSSFAAERCREARER